MNGKFRNYQAILLHWIHLMRCNHLDRNHLNSLTQKTGINKLCCHFVRCDRIRCQRHVVEPSQPTPSRGRLGFHTYSIILVQALTAMRLVTSFPAQIETRKQESTNLLSKSYFFRYFARYMCVNNACSTSESRRHLLSENIISFAIWQFVWHWRALSQPKLAPTNPVSPTWRGFKPGGI